MTRLWLSSASVCFFSDLHGMSSLIYTNPPPPFRFLSRRNGTEYCSIKNWVGRKELSSFVSVKIRISIFPQTKSFNLSNLLSKELILRLCKINLPGFLILRAFKSESCDVLFPDKSELEQENLFTEKII